jgi:hypothetical protein
MVQIETSESKEGCGFWRPYCIAIMELGDSSLHGMYSLNRRLPLNQAELVFGASHPRYK